MPTVVLCFVLLCYRIYVKYSPQCSFIRIGAIFIEYLVASAITPKDTVRNDDRLLTIKHKKSEMWQSVAINNCLNKLSATLSPRRSIQVKWFLRLFVLHGKFATTRRHFLSLSIKILDDVCSYFPSHVPTSCQTAWETKAIVKVQIFLERLDCT